MLELNFEPIPIELQAHVATFKPVRATSDDSIRVARLVKDPNETYHLANEMDVVCFYLVPSMLAARTAAEISPTCKICERALETTNTVEELLRICYNIYDSY